MTVQPGPAAGLRPLVGDGSMVPCVDGHDRPYIGLDAAASTSALPVVARAVEDFLPWYSSVHRGAGYKSQRSTRAYEAARAAALGFAGRSPGGSDVAIICRNATEAINHLAYRLRLAADDVVVTTVVEHHANLLPWARLCRRRFVECGPDGTFSVDEVAAAVDAGPRPRLLAVTGATGVPHALVAARLSAEHGIGVRHGCFCAHPISSARSGSVPTRSPGTGRPSATATTATCPAPSGPAPACPPRSPTSTALSGPSPTSPPIDPPPSATTRKPAPATSTPRTAPPGPGATVPSAPPAPEADR